MTGRLLPIIFLPAVCVWLAGCGKDPVQVESPEASGDKMKSTLSPRTRGSGETSGWWMTMLKPTDRPLICGCSSQMSCML